jgi:hypothetical protein
VEHDVLEMDAAGLRLLREMQGETRVRPVSLRRLDEALRSIDGIRGQAHQEA